MFVASYLRFQRFYIGTKPKTRTLVGATQAQGTPAFGATIAEVLGQEFLLDVYNDWNDGIIQPAATISYSVQGIATAYNFTPVIAPTALAPGVNALFLGPFSCYEYSGLLLTVSVTAGNVNAVVGNRFVFNDA